MIKSDSEDIYNITKDLYLKYMLFLWAYKPYKHKNPENKYHCFCIKIVSTTTVFNIDNNKKSFLKSGH